MNFSNEQLLKMYEYIRYARCMGDRIEFYIRAGKIAGAIHSPRGQEGVQAGLIMAKELSPYKVSFNPHTRDQALMSKTLNLQEYIDEVLCRTTGICGGTSGEYHITALEQGVLPAQGTLGVAWALDAGFAWALRAEGKKEVVWGIFGDGSTSTGITYETMNIAAIYKLPMVFVVINNGWAMSNPLDKESPVEDLSLRAQGCGMRGITIDGNDPVAVTEAMLEAIELAIKGEPNVVELKCTRWGGHFVGDNQETYRDTSFLKNLDAIDPVLIFEKKLRAMGLVDDAYAQKVAAEQDKILVDAFESGFTQPVPTVETILDPNRIYADYFGGEM
jgi:TPP-dependent pyruvate/acetoin dehydrogenase alpha subunit